MLEKILKGIFGFLILLGIFFLSKIIVKYSGLKFPEALVGLMIFATLLQFKVIKKEWVEGICNFLIKNMPLFFIPLTVGFIKYYGVIKNEIVSILFVIVLSSIITIILTGFFVFNIVKIKRLLAIKGAKNE